MTNEHVKLDRRLNTTSAAMFGLSYMSPLVVIATFGAIAVKTGGAVATAYIVATLAMLATAASYGWACRKQSDGTRRYFRRLPLYALLTF